MRAALGLVVGTQRWRPAGGRRRGLRTNGKSVRGSALAGCAPDWLANSFQKTPTVFFLWVPSRRAFSFPISLLLSSLAGSRQLEKDIAFITHSESYWLRESEGGAARVRGGRESHKNRAKEQAH